MFWFVHLDLMCSRLWHVNESRRFTCYQHQIASYVQAHSSLHFTSVNWVCGTLLIFIHRLWLAVWRNFILIIGTYKLFKFKWKKRQICRHLPLLERCSLGPLIFWKYILFYGSIRLDIEFIQQSRDTVSKRSSRLTPLIRWNIFLSKFSPDNQRLFLRFENLYLNYN